MFEKRVYKESEIDNILKPPRAAIPINDINEFLLINLQHYSNEKNYVVVKKLFWFAIHIISFLNDESDFKNSIKISYSLEIYINEQNIGVTDYLRFVSNHSYLLYITNDFIRLFSFTGSYFYFLKSNRNNLKELTTKDLNNGRNIKNQYLFVLRQIVSIYAFLYATSNNLGLLSNAGDCFYWKRYYEGSIYLNCSQSSVYNEIIRRADYFSSSNKITSVIVETEFTRAKKLFNYSKGILNRFILITTGYGEKPFRVILSMIFSIFSFSFIYQYLQLTNTSHYLHNLFFSLFAFTSFGLYQPFEAKTILTNDNIISVIILAAEIILGIILNGVFIVSLSRKIMR